MLKQNVSQRFPVFPCIYYKIKGLMVVAFENDMFLDKTAEIVICYSGKKKFYVINKTNKYNS